MPPERSAPGRNLAVDLVKLALAMMVVGIHADPFDGLGRMVHLLTAEGLFRLGVPVFLIFSGYYLHDAVLAGRGRSWLWRVLRLYAVWMALYLPVYWPLLPGFTPGEALRFFVFGYWHLWYLAGLFMADAVLVPLTGQSTRWLLVLAGASFGLGLLLSWGLMLGLFTAPGAFQDPLHLNRNPLVLSLPCLIAGFVIRREGLAERLSPKTVRIAAVAGVLLLCAETLALGLLPRGLPHDLMASLALAAPALALAALQSPLRHTSRALSDQSGGIYFLHVAFVALAFRYTDLPSPVVWLWAVCGSAALALVLSRTGLARYLF